MQQCRHVLVHLAGGPFAYDFADADGLDDFLVGCPMFSGLAHMILQAGLAVGCHRGPDGDQFLGSTIHGTGPAVAVAFAGVPDQADRGLA